MSEDHLFAHQIIKFGPTTDIIPPRDLPLKQFGRKLAKPRRIVMRECRECGKRFHTKLRGASTAQLCSRACVHQMIGRQSKGRLHQRRLAVPQFCEHCATLYLASPYYPTRFCGKSCSAKWRVIHRPLPAETRKANGKKLSRAKRGRTASVAARLNMSKGQKRRFQKPEEIARLALMAERKRGQSFIGLRGGNGFITIQQQAVHDATGLPMEHSIPTLAVRGSFASLPTHYCVDLASPAHRLAIEIDGSSHRTRRWVYLDRRKTAVLSALGWYVLRFWNREVDNDLPAVVAKIRLCMILRSTEHTIILRKAA